MKANSLRRNYSISVWKLKRKRKNAKKKMNIWKTKSLLDEIKTIFHNFCNALYIKMYKKTIAEL